MARRISVRGALLTCAVLGAAVLVGVTGATTAAARAKQQRVISTRATLPLRTALLDKVFEGPERHLADPMARAAGATYLRLAVSWRSIAPATPPQGFVATDPTSPGYNWTGIDSIVAEADAAGLTPILDISSPPDWAYQQEPSGINAGAPNSADLGEFATALATNFNGTFAGVPAEHVYQVWNEPNLSLDLSPVKAGTYRSMVNAVADAVHAVDPTNVVVAGALDPFGHPKSKKQKWYSIAPLAFMRALLCLSKGAHPHATCHTPVKFDAWSHHPYTFGGPFGHAKNPDDVELGDLPKMRTLLKAATRLGNLVSAQPVQFWVTEFGWDSNPPRKHAASLSLAARWTAESMHQMWLSGVSLVTWFLLEDYPSPSPYQSGLYFHAPFVENAKPKPVLTAFRFPFVAYLKKNLVTVWGRNTTSSKTLVTIQRRHSHGAWRTVATLRSNSSGIFLANLKVKATKKDSLRAVAPGSGKSLAFSLTVPHAPKIGPWGN